jgi:T5SS/PEP-CTERM-associated repeat protein
MPAHRSALPHIHIHRHRAPRALPLCLALAAAWLSASAPAAQAATRTWLGNACEENFACNWSWGTSTSNNWNLPAGSSRTSLPVNGDSLVFGNSFSLLPNNDIAALQSIVGISFVQGAGPYVVGGRALISTGNISNTSGQLQTINLGLTVGANQTWDGGTGGLLISGPFNMGAGTLSVVNNTQIGTAALATAITISKGLSLASGSSLTSGVAQLGSLAGSSVLVSVSGVGSNWQTLGAMTIGMSDSSSLLSTGRLELHDGAMANSGDLNVRNGSLLVDSGARFSSGQSLVGWGALAAQSATVTGAGSTWNSGTLRVGYRAPASLNVLDGATLNSGTATIGNFYGAGVATVSGANSRWNVAGALDVGTAIAGGDSVSTLTITGGGRVGSLSVTMGNATNPTSTSPVITISGVGSALSTANSFNIVRGTLQIDGATANVGALQVGALGVVNLNGGTLGVNSFVNAGSFNWTAGTLRYDSDINLRTESVLGGITTLTTGIALQARHLTVDSDSFLKLAGGNAQFDTLLLTGMATVGATSTLALVGGTALTLPSELEPGLAALDNQGLVQLSGGTLSATGAIVNRGTLTGWGAIAGSGGLVNSGAFVVSGGNLELSNTGYVHNTGSWAVLAGRSLTLSGGAFYNEGTLSLVGGSIGTNGNGELFNRPLATLVGHGEISAPFANLGHLAVDSGTLNFTLGITNNSAGDMLVGPSTTLALSGGAALAVPSELLPDEPALLNWGLVQLKGGTLSALGAVVNNGLLSGWGTFAGSGGFINNGAVEVSGGDLALSNRGYIHNLGSWTLLPGRSLALTGSGPFFNEGTMSLAGGSISGSVLLVNRSLATLSGYGVISAPFTNAGRVVVDSGVLSLTNSAGNTGEMRVNAAAATLSTRMADNRGQIRLAGGTFDNNRVDLNNLAAGVISGYGRIASGTLTQQGQLLLSGGPSTIDAAIVATAGSLSTVSGASRVTFNGAVDVQAAAEFNVAAGSVASFWAPVQQRTGAVFSGAGLKVYEAGFSVGTSPGLGQDAGSVSFGNGNLYLAEIGGTNACTLACATDEALRNASYDKTIFGGTLTLGGTLKLVSWNGFVGQAGQQFDLLDWGSVTGSFAAVDASAFVLADGTALDLSQLYTSGTVSVTAVPEPGTWALWLNGLVVVGAMARRHQRT